MHGLIVPAGKAIGVPRVCALTRCSVTDTVNSLAQNETEPCPSIHAPYHFASTRLDMICCCVAGHDYCLPISLHYVNLRERLFSYNNLLCEIQLQRPRGCAFWPTASSSWLLIPHRPRNVGKRALLSLSSFSISSDSRPQIPSWLTLGQPVKRRARRTRNKKP